MTHRRLALTPPLVAALAAAALLASQASGADPATPQAPSITVNATAKVTPPAADADSAAQQAAYDAALAQALVQAKAKAGFVAAQEGVTLGALQSVTEGTDPLAVACSELQTFSGVGVNSSSSSGSATGPVPPAVKARGKAKSRHGHRKATARKSARAAHTAQTQSLPISATNCPVNALVTVSYLIGPATGTTT